MHPKSDFQINYEAISKKVLLGVESERAHIRNDKCKVKESERKKVKSLSRVRLCDPMNCSPPGSSVHGILQAIQEWGAIAFSKQPSNLEGHIFKTSLFCKIFLKQDHFVKLPANKVKCQDGIYNFLEKYKVQKLTPLEKI